METREALNFRGKEGLKKNTNYEFPLSKFKLFKSKIIQSYYCSYLKDRNCLRSKFFGKFAKLNPREFFFFSFCVFFCFFRICRFYIFTLGFLSINNDHVKNILRDIKHCKYIRRDNIERYLFIVFAPFDLVLGIQSKIKSFISK